jgi:protein-disulfide isomerase
LKGSMRENGFRALGGLAQRLTSGLAAKRDKGRGPSIARLKAEWTAIVGADLSRITQPQALLAARQSGRTLRLKVESALALEIQHRSAQIVERVNAYFGHRFIEEIRLVQGAVARRTAPPPLKQPDAETLRRLEARAADVQDPELRAALVRLGARVAARGHSGSMDSFSSGPRASGSLGRKSEAEAHGPEEPERGPLNGVKRRGLVLGALGSILMARSPRAQDLDRLLGVLPSDHVLGRADAPNIIIDYFSLTCPHCASFHAAVLPALRSEWIDTGRLRFIYRHFPSDAVATRGSLLAECSGEKFFDTVDLLFKAQVEWMTASAPEDEIVQVMERAGMPTQACLANDRLFDKVLNDVQSGQTLGVTFTPTLFINEHKYGNPEGGAKGIDAILRQVGR